MSAITVRCEQLRKLFSHTPAVYNVNLSVIDGEILALLGPSGCGKTTTMRLIAGFERPDAGSVTLSGRLVADPHVFVPPEQRQVGMVFQNYALFPHLSVADNVAYGVARGQDRQARVHAVLDLVGLNGLERRMPHELSGVSNNGWPWRAPSPPNPKYCSLMNPFPVSMRGYAIRYAVKSRAFCGKVARR